MDQSFNRDNFERLGINNKNYDVDKVMEYALSDHSSEDKEIDQSDSQPRKDKNKNKDLS